jgi:hypothetical protein
MVDITLRENKQVQKKKKKGMLFVLLVFQDRVSTSSVGLSGTHSPDLKEYFLSANLTGSFPYLKSLKFIHCSPLTPK